MKIEVKPLFQGAKAAKNTTVIIDVFRAFSTQCYLFLYGVKEILMVKNEKLAFALKDKYSKCILIGEYKEQYISGFDLGNSPWEILKKGKNFFKGKTIIHRTSAGVTGSILAYKKSNLVLGASFTNISATISFLRIKKFSEITLVPIGIRGEEKCIEDQVCAEEIRRQLELKASKNENYIKILKEILNSFTARRFFDNYSPCFHPEDVVLSLQKDICKCAIIVEKISSNMVKSYPVWLE